VTTSWQSERQRMQILETHGGRKYLYGPPPALHPHPRNCCQRRSSSKPAKASGLQHHTSNTNLERSPHIRLAYNINKSPPPKAPNGEIPVIVSGGDMLEKRHSSMYRSGAACYPCCRKREKHVCETPRMPRYLAARRGKNNSPISPGCHTLACS
jgi:hypothetical protein